MRHTGAVLCILVLGIAAVVPRAAPAGSLEGAFLSPDWTWVPNAFVPLAPAPVAQPVIRTTDVTDAHAYLVADPFMMHAGDTWYLFFEVAVPRGKIALATSADARQWTYQHIVLSESFQLSFPYVFEHAGSYYMTPESSERQSVRLYRAQAFPENWAHVADLVTGRAFADPAVFWYDSYWWMFVGNGSSDTCWLYYSTELTHGWVEHPLSPIVANNRGRARPGGRVVVLAGNRIYRLTQNDTPTYGRALRAFQVDTLTPAAYSEHEIAESPIVQASGSGWNADGMHSCDPWWVGDHWIAAVDGVAGGVWSIGIYETSPPTDAGSPERAGSASAAPRLRATPNPFRTATAIAWELAPAGDAAPARLLIVDAAGRIVLARPVPATAGGAAAMAWDGTGTAGRRAPAGVYYCSLAAGGRVATTRIVRMP